MSDVDPVPAGVSASELRLAKWAAQCLAALPAEKRSELELLAQVEPGMYLQPLTDKLVSLWWAGTRVGVASWQWLNTGESPPDLTILLAEQDLW